MFDTFKFNRLCYLVRTFIISVFFVSALSFASGDGGGGGGSGGGGGDGGDGGGRAAEMSYEKGKKLFFENVVCDTCPYADLELEAEVVKTVWPDLKKDIKRSGEIGTNLRFSQRNSLRDFIRKRFAL